MNEKGPTGFSQDESTTCPFCGQEFTRIIGHKEYASDNYTAPWNGRGSLFVLNWECEFGHRWDQCFGFHKGCTYEFLDRTVNQEEPWSFTKWLEDSSKQHRESFSSKR